MTFLLRLSSVTVRSVCVYGGSVCVCEYVFLVSVAIASLAVGKRITRIM